MAKNINTSETFHAQQPQVELELLQSLLEPEDGTYPWNPADEESEAYFQELEAQFPMQEILDEELTTRSQSFYDQLDSIWSNISNSSCYNCNTERTTLLHLQETLQSTFAVNIPKGWLNNIAKAAADIFNSHMSMGEQLVECVQTVLPAWQSDDLLVLARPFAYAMRSSESPNIASVISNIDNRKWQDLSDIEQAKMSLAIAYYALRELDSFQAEV
jgi:hypothetical protein